MFFRRDIGREDLREHNNTAASPPATMPRAAYRSSNAIENSYWATETVICGYDFKSMLREIMFAKIEA